MAQHHSSSGIRSDAAHAKVGKIRAAHLLVKHRDSRRPSSWREANITRSKDEAISILSGHEASIKNGQSSLGDLAITESDCSSARKRGDLYVKANQSEGHKGYVWANVLSSRGFFGQGDMQKEFEEAAFALKPGGISNIVETASGVHLIER